MQKKTGDKIDRRFLSKPYHHIDANILLGELVPDDEKFRVACKNYIEEIGFSYRAGISILTLGEIHKNLYKYLNDKVARDKALEFLDKFIAKHNVKIASSLMKI